MHVNWHSPFGGQWTAPTHVLNVWTFWLRNPQVPFLEKYLHYTQRCTRNFFSINFQFFTFTRKVSSMSLYLICHAYVSTYFYRSEVNLLSQRIYTFKFLSVDSLPAKIVLLMCSPTKRVCKAYFPVLLPTLATVDFYQTMGKRIISQLNNLYFLSSLKGFPFLCG